MQSLAVADVQRHLFRQRRLCLGRQRLQEPFAAGLDQVQGAQVFSRGWDWLRSKLPAQNPVTPLP